MQENILIFLSAHDPKNVQNWSGTLFALHQALEKNDRGIQLRYISGGWLDKLSQRFNRLLYLTGCDFDCRLTTFYSICAGLIVSARLMVMPSGPILAVAASNYVPYLITRRRITYITDVPFRAAAEIYPYFKELPRWLYRQFDNNEGRTLRRAGAILVPSKWASDSAKIDYGVAPERIFELPFGANIPDDYIIEHFAPKSSIGEEFKLLFVSKDWKRKGGDKTIDICRALIKRGINVRLIVIGSAPKDIEQLEFVDARGFLKKSDRAQLAEICRAYREAHFLILPTCADASPIVFSECRAFGVPPITHLVGGTPSAINHGHTGLLLPLDAPPELFAEEMIPYVRDVGLYENLSRECRKWYVEKAHWSNWSKLIIQLSGLN
jgi:glycosyltransferase involved in cell wall biosynthesis